MFVVPNPTYPRVGIEKTFKTIYNLSNVAHLLSLVVLMTEFYIRLELSMPEYFTSSAFSLSRTLTAVMANCEFVDKVRVGAVTGVNTVNLASLPIGILTIAQHILAILVLELLQIVTGAVCMMNYTTGNRHLRIFGLHVPFYHILITFTYVYSIALVCMVWIIYNVKKHYSDAVAYCAQQLRKADASAFLAAEYDDYHVFGTPIEWAFGAAVVTLVLYTLGAVVLAYNSSGKVTVLFSEANWPWENRSVNCSVAKMRLQAHARQREAIMNEAKEALARGLNVRIVKHYEVTDENKLVEHDRQLAEQLQKQNQEARLAKIMEELEVGHKAKRKNSAKLPLFSWGRKRIEEPPPPPMDMADSFNSFSNEGYRKYLGHAPYLGERRGNPANLVMDRFDVSNGGDELVDSQVFNEQLYYPNADGGHYDRGTPRSWGEEGDDEEMEAGENEAFNEDGVVSTPMALRRRRHKRKRRHRRGRAADEANLTPDFLEYSEENEGDEFDEASWGDGGDGAEDERSYSAMPVDEVASMGVVANEPDSPTKRRRRHRRPSGHDATD